MNDLSPELKPQTIMSDVGFWWFGVCRSRALAVPMDFVIDTTKREPKLN